jgi:hypothetical protein
MGAVVHTTTVEATGKLNLSSLPGGIYFMEVSTETGQHTEKLIIQ